MELIEQSEIVTIPTISLPPVKERIILDLCGGTGSWSKPYSLAGYDVRVVTLPEQDVRTYTPPEDVYGIFAAPPCTMFSMLGRAHTSPRDLMQGLELVEACLKIVWRCQAGGKKLRFWALENPKGYLRWFLGKPALTFNPYDFGNPYRKPTDIWGNFNEPTKHPVPLDTSKRKHSQLSAKELPPVPDNYILPGIDRRTIARSITPSGFAQSFYKANK